MKSFQVSTNRTGIHRVVKVQLFDTIDELRAAYERLEGVNLGADPHPPTACMIPWVRKGAAGARGSAWEDRDPRPHLATLWFAADTVTAVELAHEATHAAAHLYSVDCYRDNARASAHLHGWNEPIAYLVADIFGAVAIRFIDYGISLDVGRARNYGTAEHPPHRRSA